MVSQTDNDEIEVKAVDDGVVLRVSLNQGLALFQCELEIDEAEQLAKILSKEAAKARRKKKSHV